MFWNAFDFNADKIHIYNQHARLTLVVGAVGLVHWAALVESVAHAHRQCTAGLLVELTFGSANDRRAFLLDYAARFERVLAAGGRVWNEAGELLLIHRRGRWDLPKGKVDSGETLTQTARREIEEETGVHGLELLGALPSTLHIYPDGGRWFLKHSVWFDFRAPRQQVFKPQTAEQIDRVGWYDRAAREALRSDLWPTLHELVFTHPAPEGLR